LTAADPEPELRLKLEAWCSAMQQSPRRRIVLNNLIYDCETGRLPREVVRELLVSVVEAWSVASEGVLPDALIGRIADAKPAALLCRGRNDLLEGKRCSRVTDAFSWVKKTISSVALAGMSLEDEIPDRLLRSYERRFPVDKIRADRREMRGSRPFAWVTQTEALDGLLGRLSEAEKPRGRQALATLARDTLGLRHYNDDEKMIEIRYPLGVPGDRHLAPPTFIEGSPGMIYRSQQGSDGWGRTVDLTTLEEGLPEAVHLPVELNADFSLVYLGRIEGRSEVSTWEKLEALCPRQYDPATLGTYLYSLAIAEEP
jgi:hypothetical protein